MLFLSQDNELADQAKFILERELERETLSIAGWRKVPVNPDVLGKSARLACHKSTKC